MGIKLAWCSNPDVTLAVYFGVKRIPPTVRCKCCRPRWTYGFKPWTLAGRLVEYFWPAHIIGHDYGSVGGYTDIICDKALALTIKELDNVKR